MISFGLLLLSICTIIRIINGDPCGNANDDCTVDITFVVDSSGSVQQSGWDASVAFVNGIIDSLGSPSNVGIIEFDHDTNTLYGMCDDQSECSVIQQALTDFVFNGGGTNIPDAVTAGKTMLESGCGDASHEKVMVLLTDGFGGDPCSIDLTGIKVYLVKVGSGTSNTAIDCLVDDINTDIFEAASFDDIMELSDSLRDAVCDDDCLIELDYCSNSPQACSCNEVTNCNVCNDPAGCAQCQNGYFKLSYDSQCMQCQEVFGDGCLFCQDFNGCGQCDWPNYERILLDECDGISQADVYGCRRIITPGGYPCPEDVIIAIDESGSVSDTNLGVELQFAIDLIDLMQEAQFGVLGFAEFARPVYNLVNGDASDAQAALSAFTRTQFAGATNYIDTINDAITMFEDPSIINNGRPNVLVIISDGDPFPNDPCDNSLTTKADLDAAGVTVVIVGVGIGFDPDSTEITCLVDNPDEQIIYEPDFTEAALNAILLDVAFEVCNFVCPNGGTTSLPDLDPFTGCPIPCDVNNPNDPCGCDDLCFCNVCHSNGCDECLPGYFKKNYNYPCIKCDESIFGDGCLFCQDFHGCGQCAPGYNRVYDFTCELYKCQLSYY